MGIGRPRTVTPPDDELIALGEEMIQWVMENNPAHLSMWWGGEKFFTFKVFKNICDHPIFSPYYEEALRLVGYNYILKGSDIEPNVKNRWLRLYFKDLRDQEDADLDAGVDRESKKAPLANADQQAALNSVLNWIKNAKSS